MKKVSLVAVVAFAVTLFQASAQEGQAIQTESLNKSIVVKIIDDMKESTRAAHQVSKQNFAEQKEAYRERHAKAIEPNPDFQRFLQAEGFKAKYNVVAEDFIASCRQNSKPNPEFQRFLQAEGFKAKYDVVVEDLKDSCQKAKQPRQ